jgi:hypothetical protein
MGRVGQSTVKISFQGSERAVKQSLNQQEDAEAQVVRLHRKHLLDGGMWAGNHYVPVSHIQSYELIEEHETLDERPLQYKI